MTPEELAKIATIEKESQAQHRHCITVCMAAGCLSQKSDQVKESLEKEVSKTGHDRDCLVKGVGCMGLCAAGPLVAVEKIPANAADNPTLRGNDSGIPQVLYHAVAPTDAPEIVASLEKAPVARIQYPTTAPFFTRQKKIVLENSGIIDPERVEEYIAVDGYAALLTVLTTMTPQEVIATITKSGLRGRGGAGYPTGLKWGTVAKSARHAEVCHLQRR